MADFRDTQGGLDRTCAKRGTRHVVTLPESDSVQLIQLIKEEDQASESEFVRRYERGIRFVIRQQTSRRDLWDDLFQETIAALLMNIRAGRVQEPNKLGSYVASTARFITIDFMRKERKQAHTDEADDHRHDETAPDAITNLERRELRQSVLRVLESLPNARDRVILGRYFLRQEEKHDICESLGMKPLHFNRVIHRAKQRFGRLFELTRRRLQTEKSNLGGIDSP